jgi:serine/threonine protein kinase/tetratricopeptide (TPR) repeat protein
MIGQTVSHYRILEKLGGGGMGVVYKAEDLKLKRTVALKFLPQELTGDEVAKRRFIHEAQAASALDHPNICTIHEIDASEDGRLFICMACYEGESLRDIVSQKPLDLERAVEIAIDIAEGLAKAHGKGIVHRDVKPANVFVTADGQVKIVDFGLAKLTGATKLTKTGMTAGTVAYMSPEQARGREVDKRTDIWALGVTLYEMITGRVPYESDYDEAVVYSILNEPAKPVTGLRSGVPVELERVVTKCLAKDPAERYRSAEDLLVDLRSAQKTLGTTTGATVRPVRPEGRYHHMIRWTGGVGLVVALVIVAGIIVRLRAPSDTAPVNGQKMLVVLPFENLGASDDAYFAAGITNEITSRLASIKNLGVISRKSAVHYANTDKTTRQIGDELGVDYVLEGTVQWASDGGGGSRVRIIPELVRVSNDTRLWSDTYDRVIEDVFEIQTDIAIAVGEQLGLALFDRGDIADDERPTENLEAYHEYLRGVHYTGGPHYTAEDWMHAVDNFERAVELDPDFALAYARLSEAHARIYYYRSDLSEERRKLAKAALDHAIELKPDLPDVHLAAGYYYIMVERDVERAFEEFSVAPENAEVLEAKGDGRRQQGKWLEAFDYYERACRLSPRNPSPLVEIAITGWVCRRYPEAMEAAEQAISVAPDQSWPYLTKGLICWSWRGAWDEAREAFEAVPKPHAWLPWIWYWQLMYEGKYGEALEHLSSVPGDWIRIKIDAKPKTLFEAFAYEALDRRDLATAAYEKASIELEAEVEKHPDDPRYRSSLGVAYAATGRPDDAVRDAKLAMELLPVSKDALYGLPYYIDLAHIYTLVGDVPNALDTVEGMLKSPSSLSVPLLEADPRWNRLRDNPEFQRLLRQYALTDV